MIHVDSPMTTLHSFLVFLTTESIILVHLSQLRSEHHPVCIYARITKMWICRVPTFLWHEHPCHYTFQYSERHFHKFLQINICREKMCDVPPKSVTEIDGVSDGDDSAVTRQTTMSSSDDSCFSSTIFSLLMSRFSSSFQAGKLFLLFGLVSSLFKQSEQVETGAPVWPFSALTSSTKSVAWFVAGFKSNNRCSSCSKLLFQCQMSVFHRLA